MALVSRMVFVTGRIRADDICVLWPQAQSAAVCFRCGWFSPAPHPVFRRSRPMVRRIARRPFPVQFSKARLQRHFDVDGETVGILPASAITRHRLPEWFSDDVTAEVMLLAHLRATLTTCSMVNRRCG